ncbi:MAG: zinc-dependent alcohol dehydrogenase family protein [Rhodospirillaceae bacterium]|nr:zinc-dependent alcohol dehydrogenase family protein [Rhodospirillaceae bacterium]
MKVLRHIGYGDIATALRLDDEPEPIPGPGEVVIRMEVAPLQKSEILNLADPQRIPPDKLPRICGSEGVGCVVAKAADVTSFALGDRVFAPKYAGLLREFMPAQAESCFPAPRDCAAEKLCIVSTMGLTSWLLLQDYVQLPAGSWIIQDAANSSIGRVIIGMARARGLRTVNVVRRTGLDHDLKFLGGDVVVVDPGDPEALAAMVTKATDNAEIKVGLDMIGGDLAGRIARCLAPGGTLVLYGGSGPDAARIDFMDLHRRDLRVTGMGMSRSFNKRSPAEKTEVYHTIGRMAAEGVIKTNIAAAYRLEDYRAAFAHVSRPDSHRDGKVIFRFDN